MDKFMIYFFIGLLEVVPFFFLQRQAPRGCPNCRRQLPLLYAPLEQDSSAMGGGRILLSVLPKRSGSARKTSLSRRTAHQHRRVLASSGASADDVDPGRGRFVLSVLLG